MNGSDVVASKIDINYAPLSATSAWGCLISEGKMSKQKSYGLEWLYLSMASFNGSGYADKSSPEHYLASYKAYKTWKKEKYALDMLEQYPEFAYEQSERMCDAGEPGHYPSPENYEKFLEFYDPNKVWL